jgi:hypothetical protein
VCIERRITEIERERGRNFKYFISSFFLSRKPYDSTNLEMLWAGTRIDRDKKVSQEVEKKFIPESIASYIEYGNETLDRDDVDFFSILATIILLPAVAIMFSSSSSEILNNIRNVSTLLAPILVVAKTGNILKSNRMKRKVKLAEGTLDRINSKTKKP